MTEIINVGSWIYIGHRKFDKKIPKLMINKKKKLENNGRSWKTFQNFNKAVGPGKKIQN